MSVGISDRPSKNTINIIQSDFVIQIFSTNYVYCISRIRVPPRIEPCCFLQGEMAWKGRVSHLGYLLFQ